MGVCCRSSSDFVRSVFRAQNPPDIAALSVPRGNGKSWLVREAEWPGVSHQGIPSLTPGLRTCW